MGEWGAVCKTQKEEEKRNEKHLRGEARANKVERIARGRRQPARHRAREKPHLPSPPRQEPPR